MAPLHFIQFWKTWSSVASHPCLPWWCHQMETSSALLALCAGNSPVTGEFPSQRPVAGRFDVFFDLYLNKQLNKQSWGWWFEMPLHPLWHPVMIVQLYWKYTFWQYLSHLQWLYLQLGTTKYFCDFYFEATTEYINAPCSLKIYGWSSKWTTPYRVIDIMRESADGMFNDSTTLLSKTCYT